MNLIAYKARRYCPSSLVIIFVPKTEFDRKMSQISRRPNDKTITFPNTVKNVPAGAFQYTPLRSVILNEGLESVQRISFVSTRIKHITFPSTLRVLEDNAFLNCQSLCQVAFRRAVNTTGDDEELQGLLRGEVMFPDSLQRVGSSIFARCPEIKVIWTGDSSVADKLKRYSS